jgi:hypothetical protein
MIISPKIYTITTRRLFSILIIALIFDLSYVTAQDQTNFISRFEIGLDALNFNKNWQDYGNLFKPLDGQHYVLEAIPAIYAKSHMNKYSIRYKIEYFQSDYLFQSYNRSTIDGLFKEVRILSGIEKYLIKKRFKVYYLIDFALSFSNYKGLYTHFGSIAPSYGVENFNINSIGFGLQPGFGITYKINNHLNISLESSILYDNGFETKDIYSINQERRLIPRPISIFGLSYVFTTHD